MELVVARIMFKSGRMQKDLMKQKMDFFFIKINPLLSNKFEFAVVGEEGLGKKLIQTIFYFIRW